ncbi:hypothetical protein RAS1_15200 [Phycisphaerae bacterium RAS1]|nr:hypothetical protein RAS1_15200 [Phycisphaerae bacterium RAS1]
MSDAEKRWSQIAADARAEGSASNLAVHSRTARAVAELLEGGALPAGVRRVRVALLRSFTFEPAVSSLVTALAAHGIAAEIRLGLLGNVAAESLDPQSFVYREHFDVCVVAVLAEHVLPGVADPNWSGDASATDAYISQIEALGRRFGRVVIVFNLAPPADGPAPLHAAQRVGSGRYAVAAVNRRLAELAGRQKNLLIADAEALAARSGAAHFWSPRDMATAMQPFSTEAIVSLGALLADLCALAFSTPVKCIALDCDNTLWGGIIGEDGLAGLKLGETYPGVCYQQFQHQLAQLSTLGFLLVLCSKNNAADVISVFEQHAGMALKLSDIAAMRVDWSDKVANLRSLAEELNIGLDSFVFIDDSDFELNFVREQLPQVRCLRVPPNTWELPGLLARARLVDRLRVSEEDRGKTQMYAQERARRAFSAKAGDLEHYLHGLQMTLNIEPFDPVQHVTRAAQLTQKTNQFNLTTRRYSEADLMQRHAAGWLIHLGSLRDRFGDYGRIVMSMISPPDDAGACRLDVFLMSCRAIGRGVEESFLRLVLSEAAGRGGRTLTAEYIPTARNSVCAAFLGSSGLAEQSGAAGGRVEYVYDLTGAIPGPAAWLTITHQGAVNG